MTHRGQSVAHTWGSTAAERAAPFPCDRFLPRADEICFRAVTVRAPAPLVFRWLCQLRAAPYSYDWLDNFGRRSPRRLLPGLGRLAPGQRVMSIFELVEFAPGRHLTLVLVEPGAVSLFGHIALSYVILPRAAGRCRLVAKLRVRYRRRGPGQWLRKFLPWGDLVMMRKQVLTLKELAERDAARAAPADR